MGAALCLRGCQPSSFPCPTFAWPSFFFPPLAQAALLLNLATVFCKSCAYTPARQCLAQAASLLDGFGQRRQAVLLNVYLELCEGNEEDALEAARRHSTVPRRVQ